MEILISAEVIAAIISALIGVVAGLISTRSSLKEQQKQLEMQESGLQKQQEQLEMQERGLQKQQEQLEMQERQLEVQADRSRRQDAAVYLDAIVNILVQIIRDFKDDKIPRVSSRALEGLVRGYEIRLEPYLGQKVMYDLRELEGIVRKTLKLDGVDMVGGHLDPLTKNEWIAKMERVAGDFQARAFKVRTDELTR